LDQFQVVYPINNVVHQCRLINWGVNMMRRSTTLRCWRSLSNEIAFIDPSACVGLFNKVFFLHFFLFVFYLTELILARDTCVMHNVKLRLIEEL
jgi:hypothetical protein